MQQPKIMTWRWVSHQRDNGIAQMALDEALLTWLQQPSQPPSLIVRTYQWSSPTLSLGVHQQDKDSHKAYRFYSLDKPIELVRRPTGGRAILHGDDISFAFVTNIPALLKMTLDESYCYFTTWVKEALKQCHVPLHTSCVTSHKDYLRSALCFETQTPSDLIAESGQKIAGSAQLRRQGALLQHGAAFLKPFGIKATTFDNALKTVIQNHLNQAPEILDCEQHGDLLALWTQNSARYRAEACAIRERLATTSGSHLVPASD